MTRRPHGFVMIAVVVTLVLCAAIALLLTAESAMEADSSSRGIEDLQARYVAQAAMDHAAWLSQRNVCSGYTLGSTPFGTHSYTAAYGPTSGSPIAISATATLASGISRTVSRAAVPVHDLAASTTIVLQPGTDGKDTFINEDNVSDNKGADSELKSDSETAKRLRALLQFDLSGLPPNVVVTSATLDVLVKGVSGAPDVVAAHALTRSWTELGATWNTSDGIQAWSAPGGDYAALSEDAVTVGATGWQSLDITRLAQSWANGTLPNNGLILLSSPAAGNNEKKYHSSDHTVANERPKLTVSYACECGVVCTRPASTRKLLLVVGDNSNMAPVDAAAAELFEAWGFEVQVRDDGQPLGGALAANHVVYVSETVDSTTLGLKLSGATIGVVSAKGPSNDELGIATGWANPVGAAIDVVNNTHYITSPFATGPLTIYTDSIAGLSVFGITSLQLVTLGRSGLLGSLVALEAGALTATAGVAPGRRVMVPIGAAPGFSWTRLNNNGRLLVQRALQWASDGAGSPGPSQLWLATQSEVSASGAPGLDAWSDGEILAFANPSLAFEPGTTNGTFSSAVQLDGFAADGDVDIDALHLVGVDITVGSLNSVDLLADDVLISTRSNETLTSVNSLTVAPEDVFVFRPIAPGNYSSGSFIFLIDGSQIHSGDTVGISLVESGTTVGDEFLVEGTFLLSRTGSRDVFEFTATDVGLNTTTGDMNIFIDSVDMSFDSEVRGLELVEEDVTLGGHSIPSGAILITLDAADGQVGDNNLAVNPADVFYLAATKAGTTTEANAFLLFEGADVGLQSPEENLQALAFGRPVGGGIVSGTVDAQVAAADDDAEERLATGTMYIDSSDLELTVDNIFVNQLVGMRFTGVSVPKDANITNAYVQFQVDETDSGVTALIVQGEAVDNAATFVDVDDNISERPRTSASVNWLPPAWNTVGDAGPAQRTPDLSAVIQEIVNRPGWASGNALAVIVTGTGTRTAEAYEGSPTGAPVLHVEFEYIPGTGGGGGGGGQYYLDRFSAVAYDNSDGTLDWTPNSWVEKDGGGPEGGKIRVVDGRLSFDPKDEGDNIYREANLIGATTATLTFDVDNQLEDDDVVRLQVYDGSSWIFLKDYTSSNLGGYSESFDITGQIASNTRVRFWAQSGDEEVPMFFDNVKIAFDEAGAPDSCDGTFRDEFNGISFSGDHGTLTWRGAWLEVGESDGAGSGDIRVSNDQSNYQLRTRDNDNGGEGVEREADLSGAASATLSYDYRRQGLDGASDYTSVEVSADGPAGPWTELTRHQGSGTDGSYVHISHDISAFASVNTRVRFKTSSTMGGDDYVWFDNVEIACTPQ